MPIHLEFIRPQDIPTVAYVISRALLTSRNSIALWGGQTERHRHRIEEAVRIVNLEHPRAETVVAWLEGRVVGALSMLPWPYCQPGVLECLRLAPRMIGVVDGAMFRAVRLQILGARLDPHQPHWHLGPVGVLPEAQGQGVGGKMIRRILEILDERQTAAYLETENLGVVSSHQKLGFRVTQEVNFLGVHNYLMWRDPGGK